MFRHLERPPLPVPSPRTVWRDFGGVYAANGAVAFVFAATGPLAIILAAGTRGGLTPAELASWVFGAFFINGLLTVLLSWRWREPLCLFWTIPGSVLAGQALTHLPYREVIGAFWATGVLVLLVGLSGWVGRAMRSVPMPVVMGMVAGVFLHFGTDLVRALGTDASLAGPMVAAFLAFAALPRLRVPPVIGALAAGAAVMLLTGRVSGGLGEWGLVHPVVQAPAWSWAAMGELVLPLAVTVLVVQNGQGFAVLAAAGHRAPANMVTAMSGAASLAAAAVGAVNSCLTGPTNALAISAGEPARHYTAAITVGTLAMAFGLLAPAFTGLLLAAPPAFVTVLGGLAMLRVLQASFAGAFGGRFAFGALVAFLVTVADVPLLHIGGAFWGLVAGVAASLLLERPDFAARPAGGSG